MRPHILGIAALFLFLPSTQAWQSANRAADEAAIRQVWRNFEIAFDKGDAKACAALYSPDADRIDTTGHFFQGRESIEHSYTDIFARRVMAGTSSSEIVKIRFLTPDVAIVDQNSEFKGLQGKSPSRKVKATTIYTKQGGTWYIAAHRPAAAPSVPVQ